MLPNSVLSILEPLFPRVYGAQVCIWRNREKVRDLRRDEKKKMEGTRTPEQTDNTNEHEPEVWRDYSEVNDLSGCVYGPEITGEKKLRRVGEVFEAIPPTVTHTNYAVASERTPIPWEEWYRRCGW